MQRKLWSDIATGGSTTKRSGVSSQPPSPTDLHLDLIGQLERKARASLSSASSPFSSIPLEVLCMVFGRLDAVELCTSISLVCSQWCIVIAQEQALWHQLCQRDGYVCTAIGNVPSLSPIGAGKTLPPLKSAGGVCWRSYYITARVVRWPADPRSLRHIQRLQNDHFGSCWSKRAEASDVLYAARYSGLEVLLWGSPMEGEALEAYRLGEFKQLRRVPPHPSVARIYGIVEAPWLSPLPVVLLECSSTFTTTLGDAMLDDSKLFSFSNVLQIALDCAKAVSLLSQYQICPYVCPQDILVSDALHAAKITNYAAICGEPFHMSGDKPRHMRSTGEGPCVFNYASPECMAIGHHTPKTAVYGIGVILWELVQRYVHGRYISAFHTSRLRFDFQVLVAITSQGLKPVPPLTWPKPLVNVMENTWKTSLLERWSPSKLVSGMEDLVHEYRVAPELWESSLCAMEGDEDIR